MTADAAKQRLQRAIRSCLYKKEESIIRRQNVFQELMPLLAQRTLLLMVSRVGADEIRISVIPQRAKSADPDQNDAIFTPLSISGTPRELDEALPGQLVEFVGTHLGLSSTLKSAKEQMDAAAKAAREMARKSTAGKATTSAPKPIPAAESSASGAGHDASVSDTVPLGEVSGSLFSNALAEK
jgi:PRTRC genetic system protein E